MSETSYPFTGTDRKTVEKVMQDEHVAINHMVLPRGEALPVHHANAPAYMIVVRGKLSLNLEGQEERSYPAGSIVAVPYRTRMHPRNCGEGLLEFFVVKAPPPQP